MLNLVYIEIELDLDRRKNTPACRGENGLDIIQSNPDPYLKIIYEYLIFNM